MAMKFRTVNPATEETLATYTIATKKDVARAVHKAREAFQEWKRTDVSERAKFMKKASELSLKRKYEYAKIMTLEMGKPIEEAITEIEKSAWLMDYYAENGEKFLANEIVQTEEKKSYIEFDPIGVLGAIMPWNFPFWQVMRFATAALTAGNCVILKHSSVCAQSGIELEKMFLDAGYPKGVFQNLTGTGVTAEALIEGNIDGVTFTGSTEVGRSVALKAAAHLKKFALELGGNDPFIVLSDADVDYAAKQAIKGRMKNTGQSCIAAKRFIVTKGIAEEFTEKVVENFKKLKVGNPLNPDTDVGPLANKKQLKIIERQVSQSVKIGAKVLMGGKRFGNKGYFYSPTVLTKLKQNMPVVKEEVFGPVMPIIVVEDDEEAIKEGNNTEFGLGASIWSRNVERAESLVRDMEAGTVCINTVVHSDPRLPFGGTKKSGFGREMSRYGMLEFVNIKSVMIN